MTIWSSRSALLAGVVLTLSACSDLPPIGLLDGIMARLPVKSVALSQTQMAEGAFTLVPPEGFCIDRNSLRQDFALMARCDTLGVPRLAAGAPLGLITISVAPLAEGEALPTAQSVANAAGLTRFDAEKSENNALTFRGEGPPPGVGFDEVHWRAVVRVNGQLMGVSLYGDKGTRAVTPEGREILNSLIRKTLVAS